MQMWFAIPKKTYQPPHDREIGSALKSILPKSSMFTYKIAYI